MIDIHITSDNVETLVENEKRIDFMTEFTTAIIHICRVTGCPIGAIAFALTAADMEFGEKED